MKTAINTANNEERNTVNPDCKGCSFNDLNQAFKILITEPYKYVLVYSKNPEIEMNINTQIFSFDTYSESIVPFSLGVNSVRKNLVNIALLQGQKQLVNNTSEIITAVKNKQKCLILNFNSINHSDSDINPLLLAMTSGINFIGQEFSDKPSKLASLILKANNHDGVSFVNVIHPCRNPSHQQKAPVKINDEEEPKSREEIINLMSTSQGRILLTGILYSKESSVKPAGQDIKEIGFADVFNKLR